MNFGALHPYPYEMYVAMGHQYYLSPTREIDPYVDLTLAGLSYGYLTLLPEETVRGTSKTPEWEQDKFAAEISKGIWSDPIEGLFKEKRVFLERSLEDMFLMIRDRERMKDGHLVKIDKESCAAKTRIFEVDIWQPALNKQADRIRANAEKEMSGLEREKRMEEIACWRDVSRLRMEMHNVLRDWAAEKRKESFLLDGK